MCTNPILLLKQDVIVQCGKCHFCKTRRVNEWAFRLVEEERNHEERLFITLTYDTKHVPRTKNGYKTLSKEDCQKFFKLLRHYSKTKIKYYLAGEYGSEDFTTRPHYHVIIYSNIKLEEHIKKSWTKGHIDFGESNIASSRYALKYINKPGRFKKHSRDDRQPEFSLKSKGLGESYLTDATIRYHLSNYMFKNRVKIEKYKLTLPRYYQKKIYDQEILSEIRNNIEILSEKKISLRYKKLIKIFGNAYDVEKYLKQKSINENLKFFNNNKKTKL